MAKHVERLLRRRACAASPATHSTHPRPSSAARGADGCASTARAQPARAPGFAMKEASARRPSLYIRGRAGYSTTTTLHVGTGCHATAGLPHGSVNAKTKMQGEMQPVRILFRSERRSARKSRRVEALILSTSTAEEPVDRDIHRSQGGKQTRQLVVFQVVHGRSRYLPVQLY